MTKTRYEQQIEDRLEVSAAALVDGKTRCDSTFRLVAQVTQTTQQTDGS